MCGLVAYFGSDEAEVPRFDQAVASLTHRGPDAAGIRRWTSNGTVCRIGHTRLRILDLDERADQPISNEAGTVWVAFNGEIYNHAELRRDLAREHRFVTTSDTEVLVHLYERAAGDAATMLKSLRGMFAFILWDQERGRLLVARDRLGIKPMYWARTARGVVFGSEVGCIVATGGISNSADESALGEFLVFGHLRGSSSPVRGVRTIPPGSFVQVDSRSNGDPSHPIPWWHVPTPGQTCDVIGDVGSVIEDAVRRHVIADRKVGVFLSGGTDSAVVAKHSATWGIAGSLTVTWPDVGDDESIAARSTALALGIEHEEVPYTARDLLTSLPNAIAAMDVPTADGLNTWIVSQAAREAGYIVVLSGVGGDELFGGYPSFALVPRVSRVARWVRGAAGDRTISTLAHRRPGSRWGRVLEARPGLPGAYSSVRSVFGPRELRVMGVNLPLRNPLAFGRVHPDPVDTVTELELSNYLPDQLLRDADQMSMAHSIELRVPLLDDEVVSRALSLPAHERTAPLGSKSVLRSALSAAAPAKRPFTLPFDTWMRGPLRPWLRDSLLSSDLPLTTRLPSSFRKELLEAFDAGRTHWSRPWTVAVLRHWMECRGVDA